jgi:hypothetical protein
MYFSPTHIFDSIITYLNLIPQVNDTSLMVDTLNWKKISGTFVANGGERYLIIGNFFSDYTTDSSAVPINDTLRQWAYYYIDDVDVHCCDCNGGVCDSTSRVLEQYENIALSVWPNPTSSTFTITSTNKIESVKMYNIIGELLITETPNNNQSTINISQFSKGIYFVEVSSLSLSGRAGEGCIIRKKLIKE